MASSSAEEEKIRVLNEEIDDLLDQVEEKRGLKRRLLEQQRRQQRHNR